MPAVTVWVSKASAKEAVGFLSPDLADFPEKVLFPSRSRSERQPVELKEVERSFWESFFFGLPVRTEFGAGLMIKSR